MKLAVSAALFVIGVAAAFATDASFESPVSQAILLALGVVLVLSILLQASSGQRVAVTLGVLVLLLGFVRAASVSPDPQRDWINVPDDGERVSVSAWNDGDARRAGTGVRLQLMATSVNGEETDFPITVFSSGLTDLTGSGRSSNGFRYGDVYEFSGNFSVATGRFAEDSAGTVFTGIVSLIAADEGNPARRSVAGIREWISEKLGRTLSEPASALARTMLVNDRTGLSEELTLDFRESGTSHILAISGLHVALISGLALAVAAALFGRRGQYYLLLPFVVTWGYAALAGFSPSVTRAAIMFSVALLARALGRQGSSLPAIGFAATLMVAISPEVLRSLSFQLSFAAIAGIAVFTPRIMDGLDRLFPRLELSEPDSGRLLSALLSAMAVSVAATVITWPLVAVNFGAAPVWGGLATIVMIPAAPLLIVLSAVSAVVAGISIQVGEVVGWPAWLLGEFVSGVAGFFRDLPPGVIDTSGWTALTAIAAYGLIFAAFGWRTAKAAWLRLIRLAGSAAQAPFSEPRFVRSGVPGWLVAVAVTVAIVTWAGAVTSAAGGELTVTFFETDRGDIILVTTPNGNTALIDGGKDPLGAVRRLDSALPFWDRSLDLLLVTHPDSDHIGGLPAVIERYDVDAIAEMPVEHDSTAHAAWRRNVEEHGGSLTLVPGSMILLDDGVTLEVLAGGRPFPDSTINDSSVLTVLRYGDVSMLLTGDITSAMERRLVQSAQDLEATVLKVPHHGSDTSSTAEFLATVSPSVAIVQVGSDNRFGHPTDAVMERLRQHVSDEHIFVTADDGDVTARTDGDRLWIETAR